MFFSVSIAENLQLAKISNVESKYSPANEISSSLKKLETRLRVYPKDYEADLLKAVLYFKSGKLDFALDELDKLIKKSSRLSAGLFIKG